VKDFGLIFKCTKIYNCFCVCRRPLAKRYHGNSVLSQNFVNWANFFNKHCTHLIQTASEKSTRYARSVLLLPKNVKWYFTFRIWKYNQKCSIGLREGGNIWLSHVPPKPCKNPSLLADHLTCSKCYFEWVACFLAIQFFSVVFACIINPVYFVLVAMTIAYYCAFLSQQSSELAWGACPNLRHRCGPSLHWRHQLHALRTGSPLHWRCASCLLQRFVSKCHVIARPFVRCYARNIDF